MLMFVDCHIYKRGVAINYSSLVSCVCICLHVANQHTAEHSKQVDYGYYLLKRHWMRELRIIAIIIGFKMEILCFV